MLQIESTPSPLKDLGFLVLVIWVKSDPTPSQHFVYLGAHFDLLTGKVGLSEDRTGRVQDAIHMVLERLL